MERVQKKKTDELKLIFFKLSFLAEFDQFLCFTVQNNVFEQTNVYVCFI